MLESRPMPPLSLLLLLVPWVAPSPWAQAPSPKPQAAGFEPLLQDGPIEQHWQANPAWKLLEGSLVGSPGEILLSRDDWRNFEFRCRWKGEIGARGKLHLRNLAQVSVGDWEGGAGGLWTLTGHPTPPMANRAPDPATWHRLQVRVVQDQVSVWINGVLTVVAAAVPKANAGAAPMDDRGPLGLQVDQGLLEIRDPEIRVLDEGAEALGPPPPEDRQAFERRMQWWSEARFGMFIHWGLYAIPAGTWNGQRVGGIGEWIQHHGKIPPSEYEVLQEQFLPLAFDADAWAKAAHDAGMKYIVITSKHHDGFALFDSKYSEWDVMNTPYGKDLLAQLAEACAKYGLKMCWYYSIMDWHHPDYLPRKNWDPRPDEQAEYLRYVEYMKNQLFELTTRYGPIGVLWFDGEWEATWKHEMGVELYDYVRSLQPDILINNRVDKGRRGMQGMTREGGFRGDFGTPEQEIPGTGLPGAYWESCMTMNDTWGFKSYDQNWKSSETLIRNLCDTASKGGNYLLNVGPTAEGRIPEASLQRMAEVGRWLQLYGEAIYGSQAGPFARLPWGRCTRKGDFLYLLVFDWPQPTSRELEIPGLQNRILGAKILGERPLHLGIRRGEESSFLRVPASAPDPAASVIRIQVQGEPVVFTPSLKPDAEGVLTLRARDAEIHGAHARYEHGADRDNIGFWTSADDWVSWTVAVPKHQKYKVRLRQACEDASAGSRFVLRIGEQELGGIVWGTGGWAKFTDVDLGLIEIPEGRRSLEFRVTELKGHAALNLQSLRFIPVEP
ncbi:MAG: DUF1080 domain-containing protein [Planctomycetota bacterium]|nr:MAG: DUF1080 domain-containing protein [Planctomycetota bacterium]